MPSQHPVRVYSYKNGFPQWLTELGTQGFQVPFYFKFEILKLKYLKQVHISNFNIEQFKLNFYFMEFKAFCAPLKTVFQLCR